MAKTRKPEQTAPPAPSENDIGSPGMLGAATAADVAHQVEPDAKDPIPEKTFEEFAPVKPSDSVALMPPDIGGG